MVIRFLDIVLFAVDMFKKVLSKIRVCFFFFKWGAISSKKIKAAESSGADINQENNIKTSTCTLDKRLTPLSETSYMIGKIWFSVPIHVARNIKYDVQ